MVVNYIAIYILVHDRYRHVLVRERVPTLPTRPGLPEDIWVLLDNRNKPNADMQQSFSVVLTKMKFWNEVKTLLL